MNYTDLITFYGTKDIEATTAFIKICWVYDWQVIKANAVFLKLPRTRWQPFGEHLDVTHSLKSPMLTFVLDDIDGCFAKLKVTAR